MKRIIGVMAVLMFVAANVYARFETKTINLTYTEDGIYSNAAEIPWWVRRMGIYCPEIGSSTIDFILNQNSIETTGTDRYADALISIPCGWTQRTSTTTTVGGTYVVTLSSTCDMFYADGAGSTSYQINSSSLTVNYMKVNKTLVSTHTALDVGTDDFSLGLSMKHDTASGRIDGFAAYITTSYATASKSRGWKVAMETDGDIKFTVFSESGTDTARTTAATYDDNEWHRLWCVRDSDVLKIYVDGVQVTGATRTIGIADYTLTSATTQFFFIGKSSWTNYASPNQGSVEAFEGYIDGIAFWKSAKSQNFISGDYLVFNDAKNGGMIQKAVDSDAQISAGTGLFYFDLTSYTQSIAAWLRLKLGTSQLKNRKFKLFMKD